MLVIHPRYSDGALTCPSFVEALRQSSFHFLDSIADQLLRIMHKLEEIYWEEQLIDDIEINLFEPECILTDLAKDELSLYAQLDDHPEGTSIRGMCLETENNRNFPVPNCLKDNLTIRPLGKTMLTSHGGTIGHSTSNIWLNSDPSNVSDAVHDQDRFEKYLSCSLPQLVDAIGSSAYSASQTYLDNIEMHSIFTPDKQSKPKEIFTQCHVCGKYVIVRMCPETGVYSKCRYCFNSPFNNTQDVIFENMNVLPDGIEPEVTITTMDLNVSNDPPPIPVTGGHSKSDGSFKCDHCGKLFTRNWYLKQHVKLHSNDKPFGCDLCDKRFLNSSNLKQHMKTHSVEYRCHICNKTYISQNTLNDHLSKHCANVDTTKIPVFLTMSQFQCTYCTQRFEDELRFREHLKSHTKELPYHCDRCDKAFRYNNSLMKHKKLHDAEYEVALNLTRPKSMI